MSCANFPDIWQWHTGFGGWLTKTTFNRMVFRVHCSSDADLARIPSYPVTCSRWLRWPESLLKNQRFVSELAFWRAINEAFSPEPSGAEVENWCFPANRESAASIDAIQVH